MRVFCAKLLRNHWHALLLVPLAVIAVSWPTFARIFDGEEFWLHVVQRDKWFKFWDAWHLEQVLAGRADFYYTDAVFHPRGVSLAFHQISVPHALALLALQKAIPADAAYNLLFLLMLCFNAFCAYLLIHHLVKDKWIALFGAVVVGVAFPYQSTLPDLIMIGTLPLTVYFFHRAVIESRYLFAALAGICAGVTAFIGMYIFMFLLITVSVYGGRLAWHSWRRITFWRGLALFVAACGLISCLRIYPMVVDHKRFETAIEKYEQTKRSNDVLDFFVRTRNPLTSRVLHSLFNVPPDSAHFHAYLGYINLLFIASAVICKTLRWRIFPWLVLLAFFAILRLGHYLTVNGIPYYDAVLPEKALSDWFPALFGAIGWQEYYQIGVVVPLAVLSSFGLARLLKTKADSVRMVATLVCVVIVALEFYSPMKGQTLEKNATAFIDWLRSEPEDTVKLIQLARDTRRIEFYLYLQTLGEYPHAYGEVNRISPDAWDYINSNLLLLRWKENQNALCLPNQRQSYLTALAALLADGFTHVVLHHWRSANEDLSLSFLNVPAAYIDEYVSVYRLADLRLNCETLTKLPVFDRFMRTPWVIPGHASSMLSYHPSQSIDPDTFAYLRLLFSDWDSLLHLYQHKGEWNTQSAGRSLANGDNPARDLRIVHSVYDARDRPPRLPDSVEFRDDFNLCRREAYEDGAVIELWLNPRFSFDLVASGSSLRVEYDNGAALENLLYNFSQDVFDLQIFWRNLPEKTHSLSVQFFDAAGDKAHGQDFVIGSRTITHHIVDLSSLPPGDYIVKLIFYRYSTGQSVAGASSSSGESFERALTIATIHKT